MEQCGKEVICYFLAVPTGDEVAHRLVLHILGSSLNRGFGKDLPEHTLEDGLREKRANGAEYGGDETGSAGSRHADKVVRIEDEAIHCSRGILHNS